MSSIRSSLKALSFVVVFLPGVVLGLGSNNPTGVAGVFNGNVTSGGSYDSYTGNATRVINDIVVAGSVGAYPLAWRRTLTTRDNSGPNQFGSSGYWRHSYAWLLYTPSWSPDFVSYPDGRTYQPDDPAPGVSDRFVASYPPPRYELADATLLLGDGGRVHFSPKGYYNIFGQWEVKLLATEIIDPYGLVTALNYRVEDGLLDRITEPGGRYLQINYITDPWETLSGDASQPHTKLVSSVGAHTGSSAPGGDRLTQAVYYNYAPFNGNPNSGFTTLASVDYSDGTRANYTYQGNNLRDQRGSIGLPLIASCDDVRYAGAMRKIRYEFLSTSRSEDSGVIYRERSGTTGEMVSQLDVPWNSLVTRDETRGDGPQRHFEYRDYLGYLSAFTDFQGNARS